MIVSRGVGRRRGVERLACLAGLAVFFGCHEPPGRRSDEPTTSKMAPAVSSMASSTLTEASASVPAAPPVLDPQPGFRVGSIAMRTWIYDAPNARGSKLGYLRAGAQVVRGPDPAGTEGCEGGWYRIEPRGYVCVGKGATLDLADPILQAIPRGPARDAATPYAYVMSDHPAPHLYFRLPSEADQLRVEGPSARTHALERRHLFDKLEASAVPEFLMAGNNLPTPYGSQKNLSYSVHRGRAKDNSAFGLVTIFDWNERRFGLTTELDVIPLDRTKPAPISQLQGVVLEKGGPAAFTVSSGTMALKKVGNRFVEDGPVKGRTGLELTGRSHGGELGLWETTDDRWIPAGGLIRGEIRADKNGYAKAGRKWISVSISRQLLMAYEGERPVYGALVSSGRGGMSDPETSHATIRGTFMIRSKHVSGTMDGDESSDDSFDLRDVPYIQYFHEGYALHAAYWHDEFGKPRSHGCINLAPKDAAWLFAWTDPDVPKDWHGAVSPQGGTLILIHK